MNIWAITMIKNEQDIIAWNVAHLLHQDIDGVLIADNMSTDKTPDILHSMELSYMGRVRVYQDKEVGYYQSEKMTNLARTARNLGADFIVPFDADELWYSQTPGQTVGAMIRSSRQPVVGVPMWNHYCTKQDDLSDPNPFTRMKYRHVDQNPLDKVAFEWTDQKFVIGQGNHNLYIDGKNMPGEAIGIGIRHFPYRSAEHFLQKVQQGEKAYAATNLPYEMGRHWRSYGAGLRAAGREHMIGHYRSWFTDECPGLVLEYNPAPYKGGPWPTEL